MICENQHILDRFHYINHYSIGFILAHHSFNVQHRSCTCTQTIVFFIIALHANVLLGLGLNPIIFFAIYSFARGLIFSVDCLVAGLKYPWLMSLDLTSVSSGGTVDKKSVGAKNIIFIKSVPGYMEK